MLKIAELGHLKTVLILVSKETKEAWLNDTTELHALGSSDSVRVFFSDTCISGLPDQFNVLVNSGVSEVTLSDIIFDMFVVDSSVEESQYIAYNVMHPFFSDDFILVLDQVGPPGRKAKEFVALVKSNEWKSYTIMVPGHIMVASKGELQA